MLLSLNSWRARRINKLNDDVSEERLLKYRNEIYNGDELKHKKPRDLMHEILCPWDTDLGLPNWKCVLRRCNDCPKYSIPYEERGTNDAAPTIKFHVYKGIYKCLDHGVINVPNGTKKKDVVCQICQSMASKKDRIRFRKELTLLTKPIGIFHQQYLHPLIEKVAFHLPHVIMLSKNYCGKMRKDLLLTRPNDIVTRRDYAERLAGKFNMEIQSQHFGTTCSLSMEGVSVEYMKENNIEIQFHSHFADKSDPNAASTHAHMKVLIEELYKNKTLVENTGTIWEFTDGCAKQYRCAKAVHLLSFLSSLLKVTIDRQIDAPGHGKGFVDGENGIDKSYLAMMMCMLQCPEVETQERRMQAATMIENASTSFAEECARLCSHGDRKTGVKRTRKDAKREKEEKLKERFIMFKSMKMLSTMT